MRRAGRNNRSRGFTLIEILAVLSVIAIFAGIIGFALRGAGGATIGLQSSESTIAGMLTFARGQAAINGRNAAVFVNNNSGNSERYLRYLVPVLRNEADTAWVPLSDGVALPRQCYVVPATVPSGSLIETGVDWSGVNSSALQSITGSHAINSLTAEAWLGVSFTPRGTVSLGNAGNFIVVEGRPQPPGTTPPVVLVGPTNLRAIKLTVYGQTLLVNDRTGL